jgi:hypothetical protein
MSEADASHAHAIQPARFDRSGSALRSIGEESGPSYAPRSPEQTLLHRVVREQLEPFLARARARERPAPHFVEQELRAFVPARPIPISNDRPREGRRVRPKHARRAIARVSWLASDSPTAAQLEITRYAGHLT